MASSTFKATSSLARYRPAILALTAIAAVFTVYAIGNHLLPPPASTNSASKPPTNSLHRSNAQRRRSTRRRSIDNERGRLSEDAPELGVTINYVEKHHRGRRVFGSYQYTNAATSETHTVWLAPLQLPSVERMQLNWNIGLEEASSIRRHMEIKFLDSFFAQVMPPEPPIPLTDRAMDGLVLEFDATAQIEPSTVMDAIERYQKGHIQDHPARSTQTVDPDEPRPTQLSITRPGELPSYAPGDLSAVFDIFHESVMGQLRDGEHDIAETESIQSDEVGGDEHNNPSEDQNLMNLLYRIAEDQARKEGFVHRGVNCNSCNAMPICGIRYRCANCPDYDLCEQCESLQAHDKTHLFYKIRIPAPVQSEPREVAPVWYPGNPGKVNRSLTTDLRLLLSTKTGIPERQVDAAWEQFQCLASADFLNDPHGFRIAIDRRDFNKCFIPRQRAPQANLIYDRAFSFYDTNNDGLIGFEEFLSGIACIVNKGSDLRARIFRSYDVDGDGFITRKDFLRMFRAYYALTKELAMQVDSGMDDDYFDEADAREIIRSSQPISSIFSGPISPGEPSHSGMGKWMDHDGDLRVVDGKGFLREDGAVDHTDYEPSFEIQDKLVADNAEHAQFGNINLRWQRDIVPGEVLEVEDDQWPKSWLRPQDVRDALGDGDSNEPVTDHVDRSLVICAGIERAQQEGWNRVMVRRRAVDRRWSRRRFYLEEEAVNRPDWDSTEQKISPQASPFPYADIRSLRVRVLDSLKGDMKAHWFRHSIVEEVKAHWPDYPDPTNIPEIFEMWVTKGLKCHEMAKALAPTRADIPRAGVVIGDLLQRLILIERSLVSGRQPSETPSPAIPSPILKRSRSPSKVRFEDALFGDDDHENRSTPSISSRSIPVGERWGGYDVPGPELDVGREILYQVTQEGMNELLDPMFKLREDLAVEVKKTRHERHLHEDEIEGCMRDGFAQTAMAIFQYYQKRWYQESRDSDSVNVRLSDYFVEFVLECFKSSKKPGSRLFQREPNANLHVKDANALSLQRVTDAIVKLDQTIAKEVSGEAPAASAECRQTNSASPTEKASGDLPADDPGVALDLHEGVATYDAVKSEGETTKEKPLELLLADAGYGVVTPPIQDFEWSSASSISSPTRSVIGDDERMGFDSTLPQHRPNSVDEWEAKYGHSRRSCVNINGAATQKGHHTPPESEKLAPLSEDRLLTLALWTVIEEDDRKRGGPGRLNWTDYTYIMEGDKGEGLGFVGSWIEEVRTF
ncbi:MAG: hypothetical protein Q9171_004283 [Xanthocarpia ochracea]